MKLLRRIIGRGGASAPFGSEVSTYRRLRSRGLEPAAIVDVGAYEGGWTRAVLTVWPDLPTLMVEPQTAKAVYLDAVCRDLPNVQYHQALLAAEAGRDVIFYEMETGSSLYPENSNAPRRMASLTTTTLDVVAAQFAFEGIFLKIDVQGAELDVLRGAKETLARTAAVQLEVPFMRYNSGAPSFLDVIHFMDERGFSPLEISNQTRLQDILVQADLIFFRKDTELFSKQLEF